MSFFPRKSKIRLALAGSLLFLTPFAIAAQTAGQTAQQPLVKLNVLVTDGSNNAITDLRQEDFRLTEDGTQQTISYFSKAEMPVSYGLIIDTTGSLRSLLDSVINTAKEVVRGNRQGDETFLMHFVDSDSIEIDQGLTEDRAVLEDALDTLFVEGGRTALIDALHRAAKYLGEHRKNSESGPRHYALVIITDGEDRGSQLKPETLLSALRESDLQVFAIGLTKLADTQGSRAKAADLLNRIARESGGRAFFPTSISELPGISKEIARDLHTQYVIGYNPARADAPGSSRKIQVTVAETPNRKKLNVITRMKNK
ncbi:MAG TPA: VWA domain-containing protein [Pyrinomonadaceae bacterium]|jgi:Ca-activated chloride channel family protein